MFDTKVIINRFDDYLEAQGLSFEAIIIGGAALNLMGVISRATNDVDCLESEIPGPIKQAIRDFAVEHGLDQHWFNNGPASLIKNLDADWKNKIEKIFKGKVLTLYTLSRLDLIRSKVWAMCDRQIDLGDCVALRPTAAELDAITPWLSGVDLNPDWPRHVEVVVGLLKKELGGEM